MSTTKIRFEDYELDFARRELRKAGSRVPLQRKPFRILELLLRSPGEIVTREELVRCLWPDSHVSFEHGLNTAVNSLRQVLGERSREYRFIETRPGLGYRFSAPVEEVLDADYRPTSWLSRTKPFAASEDYLKGRYFLDKMTEEDVYKAVAFFNAAASEASCCALANAGLAEAYCQLAILSSVSPAKLAGYARACAETAIRDRPDSPEAHVSCAQVRMFFDWDWKRAQLTIDRALSLSPNFADVYTAQASLLFIVGRYEAALKACLDAIALDPLSVRANLNYAACLYASRDFEAALEQCWKILMLIPLLAPAQFLLGLTYEQLGMYDEALVEFRNAQACSGFQAAGTSAAGYLHALMGLKDSAEKAVIELDKYAQTRYVSSYWYAVICSGRRQERQAIWHLEESVRQRDSAALWMRADARFNGLQRNEGFSKLLAEFSA